MCSQNFSSAKILLATVKDEYSLEDEKAKKFDARGGIFMPLYSALLIFIVTGVLSNGITGEKANNGLAFVVYFIYFISILISVVGLLCAIYCLLKMFSSSEYKRISFDDLVEETTMDEEEYSLLLYYLYEEALSFNRKINEIKIKYLQKSIIMIKYSLISMTIAYIFLIIIRCAERGIFL